MKMRLEILVAGEGIRVRERERGELLWRIDWGEVKEFVAWRDDESRPEVLCVGFRTLEEPEYRRCDEEMRGWVMLLAELQRRFGIVWQTWRDKGDFPAEGNPRVLWGNPWPQPCACCGYDLRASVGRCPECGTVIER